MTYEEGDQIEWACKHCSFDGPVVHHGFILAVGGAVPSGVVLAGGIMCRWRCRDCHRTQDVVLPPDRNAR